jgi:hypothetical protein
VGDRLLFLPFSGFPGPQGADPNGKIDVTYLLKD